MTWTEIDEYRLNNTKIKLNECINDLKESFRLLIQMFEGEDVLEFNDQNYNEMFILLRHCQTVKSTIRDHTYFIKNEEEYKALDIIVEIIEEQRKNEEE